MANARKHLTTKLAYPSGSLNLDEPARTRFLGLKIRFPERGVSVRARPPVLVNSHKSAQNVRGSSEAPDRRYGSFGSRRLRGRLFHRFGGTVLPRSDG